VSREIRRVRGSSEIFIELPDGSVVPCLSYEITQPKGRSFSAGARVVIFSAKSVVPSIGETISEAIHESLDKIDAEAVIEGSGKESSVPVEEIVEEVEPEPEAATPHVAHAKPHPHKHPPHAPKGK
jgi:hypothetical protein